MAKKYLLFLGSFAGYSEALEGVPASHALSTL